MLFQPLAWTKRNELITFWAMFAVIGTGIEIIAALSGGDASWDLRNYHLYIPFALLHKPFGIDIAPAHMQTFFSPTLDLIYYLLAKSISWTPLLNIALALPHALAVCLAFTLTWRLVPPEGWIEAVTLGVLTVTAATGVATLSTIAMSMSEMLPVALVTCALLIVIPRNLAKQPTLVRLFNAGLLVGAACGLKLTLSFATVSLLLVLFIIPRDRRSELLTRPLAMGIGVFLGTAALTGYWWIHQWVHYSNPVFPMLNQIIRSPYAAAEPYVDPAFLPHSLVETLQAPWSWALRLSRATSESRLRDPRFSVAIIAALVCLGRAACSRPRWRPWPMPMLSAWLILGFVLWRLEFSTMRYLSVFEVLIGAIVAIAIFPLSRRFRQPGLMLIGSGGLLAICLALTVYPQLNRTFGGNGAPFIVDLGPIPDGSLVLLLDNEPMGYLATFVDPSIRFFGTNDFFMTLDSTNPMQKIVEQQLANHTGPLFGLDSPEGQGGRSEATLVRYGLSRGACRQVKSNLSPQPIRLCQLGRNSQRSTAR